MSLLVSGLNYSTAPIAVRERISFSAEQMDYALCELRGQYGIAEIAILSTCNRVELYCALDPAGNPAPWKWLCEYHKLDVAEMEPWFYHHADSSAVRHILRVASGLDSLVLGETQILGQIKQAWQSAARAGGTGILLNRLFQHSFRVAKYVRSATAISTNPVSVAYAAVCLGQRIFDRLDRKTILLIGAGEMTGLAARHFHEQGMRRMIFANRTLENAQRMAVQFSGRAIPMALIPEYLAQVDIVYSCTASPLPILGKGVLEQVIRERRHCPMLLLDMAVPRDIEPQVQDMEDVYLYTVDDLQDIVQDNIRDRQQAAVEAGRIIDVQVDQFMYWVRSLDAVACIKMLRTQVDSLKQEVIDHGMRRLRAGAVPEQVLEDAIRSMGSKLVHGPCVNLRAASMEGRDELIDVACELFSLPDERVERKD